MTEPADPNLLRYRLVEVLVPLAADAEAQIAYLDLDGSPVDELALDFDWAYSFTPALIDAGLLPTTTVDHVDAIDAILGGISGQGDSHFWQPDALRSATEWNRVRIEASGALNELRRIGVPVPAITDPLLKRLAP